MGEDVIHNCYSSYRDAAKVSPVVRLLSRTVLNSPKVSAVLIQLYPEAQEMLKDVYCSASPLRRTTHELSEV